MTIEHIWKRLKSVKGEDEKETSIVLEESSIDDFYAELDVHLNQTLGLQPTIDDSNSKALIVHEIAEYETLIRGLRLQSEDSVHTFWESKKTEFRVLYEVANVIYAIPPTQASVERNFSALKYMLTDKRYNLKQDLLEALLLIHLNREKFNEIQTNEIYNEYSKHQ